MTTYSVKRKLKGHPTQPPCWWADKKKFLRYPDVAALLVCDGSGDGFIQQRAGAFVKQKIERIVLVVPNFCWVSWDIRTIWKVAPTNLCLLAAVIQNEFEVDVTIIDATFDELSQEEFASKIEQLRPALVGISVLMDQYGPSGHIAAKIIKQVDPSIKVVFGGIYATMNPDHVIQNPAVDYVVVGEGEAVFPELLRYLNGLTAFPARGVVAADNPQTLQTRHAERITDLDALPYPAYDKIDFLKYANSFHRKSIDSPKEFPYARIMTSRGCPIGCTFCQVEKIAGKAFRARSPQNVINEIEWLKNKYGIRFLIFDDDNLITSRRRAKEIFRQMIQRKLGLKWNIISLAVFYLDDEMLELMRESGCQYINLALESGTQRVTQEIVGKPVDYAYARKMIKKAKELGIYVCVNFMIGFPTETWDEIRQTIHLAQDIDVDYVKIFSTIPLRHTKLYEIAKKGGYIKENFSTEGLSWYEGQIESPEFTARDLSILRAYEWDRINFTDPKKRAQTAHMMGISLAELQQIRRDTLRNLKL